MRKILGLALMVVSPLALASAGLPSIRELIWDVAKVIGIGMIFGLLYYLVDAAPFINDTFKKAGKYLILLVGVLIIIFFILNLLGL